MQLYESSGAPCTVLKIKLSFLLSRPCFKILGTEQFARIDLQEIWPMKFCLWYLEAEKIMHQTKNSSVAGTWFFLLLPYILNQLFYSLHKL